MKASIIIRVMTAIFLWAPAAQADDLCQKEFGRLVYELEEYDKDSDLDSATSSRLLEEYHSKKQMLPSVCARYQIERIQSAFDKAFRSTDKARTISSLDYKPRKTVEIGVVEDYAIFKRK
jgi:hypothetical protein